ncbi:MAG: WbuC family cupin fold metalloprotein [Bacteroidales bacterium]|jgi:cupin fold WbuC family metalloprotein|nr:WbuC family cupin fold metalloprotein [Bacteroidales bacterium]MDD2631424.1 WbuC family cupin fold metalloprotein [Bacteroidales bacterium]MDD3132445.1 WbuC family cupin fold metalloprotein [Bacteroidales bacterium]MDD3525397.1 WbuC family cupin fold metalloprotein [Bacteroidales bacterium]MDD4175905.1 WbuC family cupin fold metalloprotein [Bacteroidales bacterium]
MGMIKITDEFLDVTSRQAKQSPRRRMNYNFHPSHEDPFHRLLNAMEPGTYVQPHKHENPDKFEIFLALRGRFVVFIFDELGNITDHIILDAREGNYGVEIAERTYHTLVSLEPHSVAYEVKAGPYTSTTSKNFAPWAPAEGDEAVPGYLEKLLATVGLSVSKK